MIFRLNDSCTIPKGASQVPAAYLARLALLDNLRLEPTVRAGAVFNTWPEEDRTLHNLLCVSRCKATGHASCYKLVGYTDRVKP